MDVGGGLSESLIRRWNHRRLDWMRAQKLRFMRAIFDPLSWRMSWASNAQREAVLQNEKKEILVLRLDDKLGDSVTATGFLRELKNTFSDCSLTVVAGPLTGQIYQNQPTIDRVLIAKKGFVSTLKLFFQLRSKIYNVVINTSHIMTPRTIFLMSQLRAIQKMGFRCHEYRLFTDHVEYDPLEDHVTTRYQNTLQALGGSAARDCDLSYELHIPLRWTEEAQSQLQSLAGQKIVILNSFAGARLRSLNEKISRAIVEGILRGDPGAVVISIGNHNDLPVIAKWIERAAEPRWVCFLGSTEFFGNCALIDKAGLVISPDTAIVHVASAFKKPQVAIFREDSKIAGAEKNSKIWAPTSLGVSARVRVILAPDLHQLRGDEEPDINDVNVELVVNAALDLLRS